MFDVVDGFKTKGVKYEILKQLKTLAVTLVFALTTVSVINSYKAGELVFAFSQASYITIACVLLLWFRDFMAAIINYGKNKKQENT